MEKENVDIGPSIDNSVELQDSGSMALDKLLAWDGNLIVKDTVHIDRLDMDVTIRSITQEELEKYNSQSEMVTKVRNTGVVNREIDPVKLGLLTVFHCVVDPNLSNEKLQLKHNSPKGKARELYLVVNRIFLPGESVMLSEAILSLSGFASGAYVSQAEIDENLSLDE